MKTQSAALAIVALVLWLVPSGSLAKGNSGKSRLTICHISPGNPDAGRTMTVPEPAWGAHESHGDFLGPCDGYRDEARDDYGDEYGDDTKRAKKSKKAKKKDHKKSRSESDGDDADDDADVDDRADDSEEVDETERRAQRENRRAERRARRQETMRDQDGKTPDEVQAEEDATSGEAGAVEAGDADTGADDTQAAEERSGRKARTGGRNTRGAQPDAEAGEPPEEDQGFFRGMRRFFGFSGDEEAEPSGE